MIFFMAGTKVGPGDPRRRAGHDLDILTTYWDFHKSPNHRLVKQIKRQRRERKGSKPNASKS